MSDDMGAVRRYGHLLAGLAVVLAGCSDPDSTTATSSPRATPHATGEQPEATATPVRPTATPTPAEVPSGPDDPGWAEHLGLTEEELERRRASDDFLEWAEPRRARESPGADRTFRRMLWQPHQHTDVGIEYLNPEDVWTAVGPPFRDMVLARGTPLKSPFDGLSSPEGYAYISDRSEPTETQQYILFAFYRNEHGEQRVLVHQVALSLDMEGERRAFGEVVAQRSRLLDAPVDGRRWPSLHAEEFVADLTTWGDRHAFHDEDKE